MITADRGVCFECSLTGLPSAGDGREPSVLRCLPAPADRLRRADTPITRYRYPEALFGADDGNVRAVKAAAAKAGRSWHMGGGEPEVRGHREDLERLARGLGGTDTARRGIGP